jgi:hypothetical protein
MTTNESSDKPLTLFELCNSLYEISNPKGVHEEMKLMCLQEAAEGEASIFFYTHPHAPALDALEKLKQELPWGIKGDKLYFYFTKERL